MICRGGPTEIDLPDRPLFDGSRAVRRGHGGRESMVLIGFQQRASVSQHDFFNYARDYFDIEELKVPADTINIIRGAKEEGVLGERKGDDPCIENDGFCIEFCIENEDSDIANGTTLYFKAGLVELYRMALKDGGMVGV